MLFTEETRFTVDCDTRRIMVRRERGTLNYTIFVQERLQYRRRELIKWGRIIIQGRMNLHTTWNGTLKAQIRVDEILSEIIDDKR